MRVDAGTVLGNRYQLTTPIASGGMGEVWEAHDELLGRTVAVKVLRSELASDAGFLARFRTEARNSARLAHPAIAATYDYGESDGSAWLVMELVPGEPLSDLLATQHSVEPRRAMRIIASAASGLAAAHEAGIVHRDVKPGNLLVTPTGGVKVTDFGIARAAAEAPLTATGQVMGTAAYLSPEQATGRRDLTPAVDVYALGVVAHEMLAGQRPFTGESQVAIALAQVNDPPPPLPSSVPAGARALVDACLAKDPNARPRDAAVVAQVASLVADGDDARAQRVLLAGLGSAAAAAAGAAGASTVALPPTADATRAMPPQDDETVPWPEPAAPATRRSAQAAAAAYAAGAGVGAGAGAAHGGAYPRTGMTTGPQGTPEPTGQRSSRGRMTVPLLGLLAVLVLVLAALVYLNGQRSTTDTPQNAPLSTVSPSTSTSPSPERTTVTQTQTETATSSTASESATTATTAPSESASQSASAPATTASEPASSAPAVTPSTGASATPGASGTAGGAGAVGAAGAAVQGVGGA